MPGNEWYYVQGGRRFGPVAFQLLQQLAAAGEINPGDSIWSADAPERAVPARNWPGLFVRGTESQRTINSAIPAATPPASTPSSIGRFLLKGFMGICTTVGVYIIGIVVFGLVWGRSGTPSNPLPLETKFRTSLLGRGMVLQLKNLNPNRPLDNLVLTVTAAGGEKAGRSTFELKRPLESGVEMELGWIELHGWELAPGETIQISHALGSYEPLVLTVPTKTVSR